MCLLFMGCCVVLVQSVQMFCGFFQHHPVAVTLKRVGCTRFASPLVHSLTL